MNAFFTNSFTLVFVGGGIGSVVRYGLGRLMLAQLAGAAFPVSILVVNVVASFVLGGMVGFGLARTGNDMVRLLVGVGFCGGLSTFSSFSQDTLILLQTGRIGAALLNIGLNVVFCLLASAGGLGLGQRF